MKAKSLARFGVLALERMGIKAESVNGPAAVINPSKGIIPVENHKKVITESKVTREEIQENVDVLKTVPGGSSW